MLKNYLTVIRRNLFKQKTSSLINIAGMAIAIASCLFILLYIFDELQFDRFNKNEDYIYRLVIKDNKTGEEFSIIPAVLFHDLMNQIPEFQRGFEISRWLDAALSYKQKIFSENVFFAGKDIFKVLSFSLKEGNPNTALTEPLSVVITPAISEKYFGNENPIGKVLKFNNQFNFKVTGILNEVPRHSSLRPSIIASMSSMKTIDPRRLTDIRESSAYFYFLVNKNASLSIVNKKLNKILEQKYSNVGESPRKFVLEPLSKVYLYAPGSNWEIVSHGSIKYVRSFAVITLLILLMASFNYTSLLTVNIKVRGKEFAVRRLLGADRRGIFGQFLLETAAYLFISLIVALVIVDVFMNQFNQLTGKHLELASLLQWQIVISIIALILFTVAISIIYPLIIIFTSDLLARLKGGLYISRFKPAKLQFGFRQIVTGLQFVITIFLIAAVIIIYKQLNYMLNQDLGFNKEHLLSIQNPYDKDMYSRYEELKNEVGINPHIISVTAGENVPSNNINNYTQVWIKGKKIERGIQSAQIAIDYGYLKTLQVKFIVGRDFSRNFKTDAGKSVILNQAACEALGLRNPIGAELNGINNASDPQTVIGVVKNIHYESFKEKIPPIIYYLRDWSAGNILLRLKGNDITSTMKFIEKKWKGINKDQPFIYSFLDQSYDKLYKSEQQTGTVVLLFCFFALIISCIGLFGLISLLAQTRRKEIGIRKVLGASVFNSFLAMTKEFLIIILAANLIALPAAYYLMHNWLQDFSYRININWWIFIASGSIALLIALAIISFQVIRVATANPVKSLRYE